ncbi:15780_t:CDS:2 [Funneliformis caledonium]|uniref:15780_t:CDS:1 n=1 Tax=Funneliformis caledonium TaxID=1117310 RepID=A0A9N9CCS6_9GLOM|nr:15780_t:CDS:2 [Funneliformis caledonium]
MAIEFLSYLSNDFSYLLENPDFNSDITIEVTGEDNSIKIFKAHSIILYARSEYFKQILLETKEGIMKRDPSMVVLRITNITPTVFSKILRYIYSGIIDLESTSGEDTFGLLIASSKLHFPEVVSYVQEYLVEKHKAWLLNNFSTVVNSIFKLEYCRNLQNFCTSYICVEANIYLSTRDSLKLNKRILSLILNLDNLYIEEDDVWEFLMRWGIEHTKVLLSKRDITKWNGEDIEELRSTLDGLIPLIRFREISSDDFYEKIRPYKIIIPHEIYEDIMAYHLIGAETKIGMPSGPRRGFIDSVIINSKQAAIVSNWIDGGKPDDDINLLIPKNNPYTFSLIYRGSQDGLNLKSFREKYKKLKCSTILVVKLKNSDKIIGGYSNYFYYFSTNYNDESGSFLFNFDQNIKSCKKIDGLFKNLYNGLYDFNTQLVFAHGDLTINFENLSINCKQISFKERVLKQESAYQVEDIELFRPIWK